MQQNDKVNSLIESAINNLNGLVNVNTVVGNPFVVDNATFLPITKVTFGLMSGGGEQGESKLLKEDNTFVGGNGTIVSIKPLGFLMKTENDCKIISTEAGTYEKLFEKASDFINSIMEKKS